MGQENLLNCRSSGREEQHEVQTTQLNAINFIKNSNHQNQTVESDIKSKKSTIRTDSQLQSIIESKIETPPKTEVLYPPQHENITKVSQKPFPNSQISSKNRQYYQEKTGKSLAEIVESRYNTTMHFPHRQVITLVQSLVYSLAYLKKHEYKHHDYYPTNIFYSNGIFKVSNPLVLNCSGYTLTQERKRFSFLSPQLISEILEDVSQAQIPTQIMNKSDIFSIGMILLQFCTLQSSAECYDEESYSLVDKAIRERIEKVAQIYSPAIADFISQTLNYEVEKRIGVQDLSILVFMNSQAEKQQCLQQEQQQEQQERMSVSRPNPNQPPQGIPNRPAYVNNPLHLQPNYIVMTPGQIAPPGTLTTGQIPAGMPPPGYTPPGQILPLNLNNIAVPTPNYSYSRIGPNNQGLLSPSTLHNKLRVIELIHQKPQQQEDSDIQLSSLSSNMLSTNSNQPSQILNEVQTRKKNKKQQYESFSHSSQQQIEQMSNQLPRVTKQEEFNKQSPIYQASVRDQFKPTSFVTSYPSTKFTTQQYIDKQNPNETLQQRVQRILQMSRSIK